MKLKYTLVFTIISFFIATAGFAQTYSDQEIGLNVEKLTAYLREHKVKDEDLSSEISKLREMYTVQYVKLNKKASKTAKAQAVTDIPLSERNALIALYNSTGGENWFNNSGWDINDPNSDVSTWYGIQISYDGQHVTNVTQYYNNLVGTIPTQIDQLDNLTRLSLPGNKLTGSIPVQVFNLINLYDLNLPSNQLSGSISPQIGNLKNLTQLDLVDNRLTGSLPAEIGQLSNLERFEIGNDFLTGEIPVEIYNLKKLTLLSIYSSGLTGGISPEIRNLSNLEYLYFDNCRLTGNVPSEIGQLTALKRLHIRGTLLSGIIPTELGQLSNLDHLELSYNQFTGAIPTQICNLTKLNFLFLWHNQLSGIIPTEIGQLTNLETFNASINQLTGTIPTEIGQLKNLASFDVSSNQLTGIIPTEIGQCTNLALFSANSNQLTGIIPSEIGQCTNLNYFTVTSNQLTGMIPSEIGQCIKLTNVFLNDNQLSGAIPAQLANLVNLKVLNLNKNQLYGELPANIGITQNSNLYLVLANNKFRFVDIINEFQNYKDRLGGYYFSISPQAKINHPETINKLAGENITLKMFEDNDTKYLPNDTYQWFIDGFPIQGATGKEYTIFNARESQSGVYICKSYHLVNPDMSPLVLEREPVTLQFVCPETTGEITADLQAPTTDQTLTFSFTTTATNISWYSWTFYNPNNSIAGYSSSSTPRQYFYYEGTCKAKLEVTTIGGCKTTFEKNITVVKPPCVIVTGAIKTSVENITANQDFKFSLETTNVGYLWYKWTYYNADGTVLSIEDGSNSTGYKYYPLPGNYRVNLVVRDSYGCTTSFDKIITISPQICAPVTGSINTSLNNFFVNATSSFSFDSPLNLTYKWTFYDLNNNVSETYDNNYALKSFDAPGTYKVNLLVTEQNRCVTSIDKTITVTQPQACTSTEAGYISVGETDTIYANTDNQFNFYSDTSQNLHFKWTIYKPNNTIYNTYVTNNFYLSNLNFESAGEYRAVVEITDKNGCTATFNKTFTVIHDCRTSGMIKDVNDTLSNEGLKQVAANTPVSVLYYSYVSDSSNMEFSWSFISPSGEVIKTGNEHTFDVLPTTIGDYKILVKMTDPVTGCVNDFSAILPCVDECRLSDKNRTAYISLNGEYAYSDEVIFLDLNQTTEVGLYRPPYDDLYKTYDLEWSFYSPTAELISTGTDVLFPITLTTPGYHQVVVKVIDRDTGCSTEVTRAFGNKMDNSCTQTNERSSQVKELARALAKKLLERTASGETDAQINNSVALDEFIALKPFITNSPKDKIYNYKTTRDRYNAINSVNFSFSPDREYDFHITIRDGLYTNNGNPDYLNYLINEAVYLDISQYVSSNETLASCWVYGQNNRSAAKSVLNPKDCRYSTEIKNIDFCPPLCNAVTGTLKQSTQEVFTNRNTNFSLETTATDLTYKWTFYNLDNDGATFYTTNTVDKKYTQEGSYDIRLEVTDSNGCLTTFNKTVIATVNTNCTAIAGTIKTSTPEVFVGTNTNFSLETTATDLSYKWTFTQNSESTIFTTKTVDYTYIQPGTNNVILEVIDSNGCKFTFQKSVSLKTGSSLCDNVTQFGRAFVQVGSDTDLFKAATITVNQTTNVTFPIQSYGSAFDFEYRWSLLNENNQLVDSGTSLNFPIVPTSGGFYRVVLDLKENTSGCVHQFSRSIVCLIPNSCGQTNPQSSVVKGLVTNLIKNLIGRAMLGENDTEINSSTVNAEFNALKPYITSGVKDKIYNFASTRNLNGEFTGVDFSFSPDRTSDIHISIPHSLRYEEGMPIEDLLSLIESKIYINTNQYRSSNQYLISCYTQQSTGKSLLKPNDCQYGSEIRFIDFCPNECDPLLGVIKLNNEKPTLNTVTNFSLETAATGLTYNWTFYNADNSIKETQTTATGSQTYTVAGTYKVILIATDANNCPTTFTKTITISAPSCVAATGTIKTVLPSIFVGTTANFFFDTTATNLTYQWTLYRTVTSSTATFTTSTANMYYDAPGNYNVKLLVTDTNGCTNTFRTTAIVTVKPPCVAIPGEIKTANPIVSTNQNTTFSFETTATNLRYNWTFHSLNNTPLLTTTVSNPTLMYPYANNFKVTLIVTDENDCSTTIEKTISVVRGCPVIPVTITIPETVSTNEIVPFAFTSTYTSISNNWTFYNLDNSIRSTSGYREINKTYTSPGTYRVNLEITDLYDSACKTSIDKTIIVTGDCSIPGTIESNPGDAGVVFNQYVVFRFESPATDLNYTWTITKPDNSISVISPVKNAGYYFDQPGTFKIAVEVSDHEGCKINLEKTYNIVYDCSWARYYGYVENANYSSYVLPNVPLTYQFYPYSGNPNFDEMELLWEFVNSDGEVLSTATTKEFNVTPSVLGQYKINFKTKDKNGCEVEFYKDMYVLEPCEYSNEYLSGFIGFENENNVDLLTIQSNQPKELMFHPYQEITKTYTYKWEIYNVNDELVDSGNQEKHSLTLTTTGLYKINITIENESGCILHFSKPINCLIENSCTTGNPNSEIVKKVFINFVKSLILKSLTGLTDQQINTYAVKNEFEVMKSYITNGTRNRMYNYASVRDENDKLIGVKFSFSPDRDYDVLVFVAKGMRNYQRDGEETMSEFSKRIETEIYFDISQYVSSDNYLTSCYVQNALEITQNAEKTSKTSKTSKTAALDPGFCSKSSEVRYIDFCPAEVCLPTIGEIKSGFTITNPSSQTGKNSQKPSSKL